MKFSYFKFPLSGKSTFFGPAIIKPIIPVKLMYEHKEISHLALIDSGADFNIFDAEIGEYLGIVIKAGAKEEFGGVQNLKGSSAYLHKISVSIGGWDYKTTIGFFYDIATHGYGILGQKGFFNMFSVKFDYQKEEIELKGKLSN